MEQQPQIGTLQQAGCAACPNQWGVGCNNTIYIYCILYICIYWMDLDGLNRNVIVIFVIHFDVTLMFTVSECSMSLQQEINSA